MATNAGENSNSSAIPSSTVPPPLYSEIPGTIPLNNTQEDTSPPSYNDVVNLEDERSMEEFPWNSGLCQYNDSDAPWNHWLHLCAGYRHCCTSIHDHCWIRIFWRVPSGSVHPHLPDDRGHIWSAQEPDELPHEKPCRASASLPFTRQHLE